MEGIAVCIAVYDKCFKEIFPGDELKFTVATSDRKIESKNPLSPPPKIDHTKFKKPLKFDRTLLSNLSK